MTKNNYNNNNNNNNNNYNTTQVFEPQQNKIAFVIENVFTEKECKEWIDLTEKQGYEKALVNIGYGRQKLMTNIRNNERCIIDSEEMADKLYQRIKNYIPETISNCKKVSLNERLRFLRYHPGQEFKWHYDGVYAREHGHPKFGERSYITIQLYLNHVEEGGETSFSRDKEDEEDIIQVLPKMGSVLVFEHNLHHCGSPVTKGVKYCVRTDVMYSPNQRNAN
ncbi:hypothetical protein DICPUDRAFT_153517 [Dictyostelium purpureum]|uniref:Fe2OG dioxygenase domain-containing protein n=1 Tax=Dictyostelium purpureum TaxID=5786 RepID=F0ZP43_DICPU|nr:uncharacterized protein DICPUDRAFT_153517 [Dictyostelium purpureum]EGC34307.1 hypothetical protein DICPUDRAFT_153517 [Dictyostelium purpureum]|eukprot:XP_003289189.1 hypothetical protein DICPUDRAFT_153517 [Dictyostelium purpureum]